MQRQRIVILAVTALAIGAAQPVKAEDRTGWGVSAAIGLSQIQDKDGSDTFRGNGFGLSPEFEYRFTPNFALGLGGFSLGRAEDRFGDIDTEIAVRGYELFGRVIFPVSTETEIYGRIGSANYFVDIDPGSVSLEDAIFGQDALAFGVGADFARREQLAFRLEGRFYNGGADESGALLLFGIHYQF